MPSDKCEKTKHLLPDFATGHVDDSVRREIEEHISVCLDCRAELEDVRKTISLVQQETLWKPSESYWMSFLPRVNARLAAEDSRLRVPAWVTKFAIPLAAALLALVIISRVQLTDGSTYPQLKEIAAGTTEDEMEQVSSTLVTSSTVSYAAAPHIEVSHMDDGTVAKLTRRLLGEEAESHSGMSTMNVYADESALHLESISDQDFEKILGHLQEIEIL